MSSSSFFIHIHQHYWASEDSLINPETPFLQWIANVEKQQHVLKSGSGKNTEHDVDVWEGALVLYVVLSQASKKSIFFFFCFDLFRRGPIHQIHFTFSQEFVHSA
ncbi:unnamed protein product [Allacma fusca]|uniref:Uncharacterized protein n=1 Tax=Allacma fusca TaxID=39272 RepID=A0A8J2P096_9HEXA|nr:unnamed protein product [Allacma fusca]